MCFQNKRLCLCEQVSLDVLRAIFHAALWLTELCLGGANVVPFISWTFRAVQELYEFLKRLILGTEKSLEEMSGDPIGLHAIFDRMPALKWLCMDSYDIWISAQCYHLSVTLA